ncbi:ArsR family transcriptional regulator [Cryobacterium sp. TMT1-21]|uniref:ArsR family transcriptional regulator n=1 Tax=Cryobacterium shii TaxID=1259235 RepID=A0AAQ2C600_9MICO|nr:MULTISPECIES: helix-turn-helix domain-containing protein [Cryobacterium]TFC46392.1 ArsR family transcriptional regulator [Cryobacterium shii]TFD17314.1 ArsR family transcriptional regulator [Cryobacterium sp. TMT1-21]TFD22361.1 ArsR family transcriptional regulator [Cryobacterium sp. TMT4-10]TFD39963.1 ArsR family transcriptional regulator [Cryobacterium sp. TMT2-10]
MNTEEGNGDRHAALASDARRQVLDLLMDSASPLDAAAVAGRVGLHVTTARFHLDQLENAGLIRRAVDRAGTRGRPRILFTAGPATREDGAQHDMSRVLAGALAEDDDRGRARATRAGERWSSAYADELRGTADEGVRPLLRILDRLGFDPDEATDAAASGPDAAAPDAAAPDAAAPTPAATAPAAPVIALHACPFRDDARRNTEVICSVHLGLVRGVARDLGRDPDQIELRPFVGPELCHLRLGRDWADARA